MIRMPAQTKGLVFEVGGLSTVIFVSLRIKFTMGNFNLGFRRFSIYLLNKKSLSYPDLVISFDMKRQSV